MDVVARVAARLGLLSVAVMAFLSSLFAVAVLLDPNTRDNLALLVGVPSLVALVSSTRALLLRGDETVEALAVVLLSVMTALISVVPGLILLLHLLRIVAHEPVDVHEVTMGLVLSPAAVLAGASGWSTMALGWTLRFGPAERWLGLLWGGMAGLAGAALAECAAIGCNVAWMGLHPTKLTASALLAIGGGWLLLSLVAAWHATKLRQWADAGPFVVGVAGVGSVVVGGFFLLRGVEWLTDSSYVDAWNILFFLAPFAWIAMVSFGGVVASFGCWLVVRSMRR